MSETQYNDLAGWLSEVEATTTPSGFHGQVVGLWCRHSELPADLALDEVDREACAWPALMDFAATVKAELDEADCRFDPLLPPDSAPLDARLEALADWAEGLLFGIGSAGELDRKQISEEAQELMRDLAEICKVGLDDNEEGLEEAYAEVVEYLKVAAQTLFLELRHVELPSPAS